MDFLYSFFDLNIIWFLLLGILLTGYAILDGFDLGVGALHLFTKGDYERRVMINSIGPIWDGNEVWLVTGGGAMFAAFPEVYATVFSGMYEAIILLLVVIIFRAVSIEFRSKHDSIKWRNAWDIGFGVSSILIAFIFGVALANVITGLPIGESRDFNLSLIQLLSPFTVLVGFTTVSLFAMHGSIYVVMKTEGDLQEKIKKWVNNTIILFVMSYVTTTMMTLIYYPHMAKPFIHYPELFIVAFLNMLTIANIPREINKKNYFHAFISSSMGIVASMVLVGIGLFPNLVISSISPLHNMTIYNSSSSEMTLGIMLLIALIAAPVIVAYTAYIYWVFRGTVKLDSRSY